MEVLVQASVSNVTGDRGNLRYIEELKQSAPPGEKGVQMQRKIRKKYLKSWSSLKEAHKFHAKSIYQFIQDIIT